MRITVRGPLAIDHKRPAKMKRAAAVGSRPPAVATESEPSGWDGEGAERGDGDEGGEGLGTGVDGQDASPQWCGNDPSATNADDRRPPAAPARKLEQAPITRG